jgi:tripeptide aminopeptidase
MIPRSRAVAHLMDLLRVEGLSGQEADVALLVKRKLKAAGCKPRSMRHDTAHEKIGKGYQIGNLIVDMPGIRSPENRSAQRLMFSSHMDTVPLCRDAKPVIKGPVRKGSVGKGGRIISSAATALGADNRTAVACLVTLAESLLKGNIPHPPLTLLFTVGEEVGLKGARQIKAADLGRPKLGFNIDSGAPAKLVIGATGADRWEVEVLGVSSHAGVHPEDGVSAVLIASRAIAEIGRRGFFGKVRKGRRSGTSNVGVVEGGEITNQVLDRLLIRGESRSHDPDFLETITREYRETFERAAKSVTNAAGKCGRVKFRASRDYHSFRMDEDCPAVRRALEAAARLELPSGTVIANGGLDANWLNRKGIPTVTFGAGQHNAHTVNEYADLEEYWDGCRLAVEIARGG